MKRLTAVFTFVALIISVSTAGAATIVGEPPDQPDEALFQALEKAPEKDAVHKIGRVTIHLKNGHVIQDCEAWVKGEVVRVHQRGLVAFSLNRSQIENIELFPSPVTATTTQTTARKPPPEKRISNTPAPVASPIENSTTRTMTIEVIDASTGKPITNAEFKAYADWDQRPAAHIGNGKYRLVLPPGNYRFSFEVHAAGHVQMDGEWRNTFGEDPIPSRFTVKMNRGVRIGGRVVNEKDEPVSGAKVRLYIRGEDARAGENAVKGGGTFYAETGADGRWHFDEFPRWYHLDGLAAAHPDYAFGHAMPTESELLAQNAQCVVKTGVELKGHVIDESGAPIENAQVMLPGFAGFRTDARGEFRFAHAVETEHEIYMTAYAKGFAPSFQWLKSIRAGNPPVEFRMSPGHTLRIRVVDQQGRGIANAEVGVADTVDSPGNPPISHFMRFPDGDKFRDRAKTDQNGYLVRDSITDRETKYWIMLPGYRSRHVAIKASNEVTHTFTLEPYTDVTASVTDAQTGKPIDSFQVNIAEIHNDNSGDLAWAYAHGPLIDRMGGVFRHRILDDSLRRYKFIAPGYKTFESRLVKPDETTVTLDIKMIPDRSNRMSGTGY
ncbi:carboxypeptidase-like regulatory domain-containing protein [bacterium]|nr:carboxypeptidase-like regulatory domain-containing protein [bacterium]